MTTEFDKDKVMSRVRKMLALANDAAATEGERDNTLRMAHATLAKYNLTLGEATLVEDDRGAGEQMLRTDAPWMRTVAVAVAKLFFCEFFYTKYRSSGVKYSFVGKEANSMTAAAMTQYVIKSILKETRARAKNNPDRKQFARSFAKGCRYPGAPALRGDSAHGGGCTGSRLHRHRARARVAVPNGAERQSGVDG